MTSPTDSGRLPLDPTHIDFDDLSALELDLLAAVGGRDVFEERLRSFFRSAIDEVIDTARTGRYFLHDIEKTEKTYLGTKFEILLRDWLQVPKGVHLDLMIGGREVDVKTTTSGGSAWMIPPEAIDQLCILLRVNEEESTCAVGLARARRDYLRSGVNRDGKTGFSAAGRKHIWWLAQNFDYTPNFWTQISVELREQIMGKSSGTKRIAELFKNCLEMPISRVLLSAVAKEDDFTKRLRQNSGARDILDPLGIVVFYTERDRVLMHRLGLVFGSREFMSYRATNSEQVEILRSAGNTVALTADFSLSHGAEGKDDD